MRRIHLIYSITDIFNSLNYSYSSNYRYSRLNYRYSYLDYRYSRSMFYYYLRNYRNRY